MSNLPTVREVLIDFFNEAEADVHSNNFKDGVVITKAHTKAEQALQSIVTEIVEEVIGEDIRPFINGKHPVEGEAVNIDLVGNRDESCIFIQENGKRVLQKLQRLRAKQVIAR